MKHLMDESAEFHDPLESMKTDTDEEIKWFSLHDVDGDGQLCGNELLQALNYEGL